ncbi:MAG: hypothetical protein K2I21_09485, partial [Acetatifactor sp.]|nr:hypothetical protein [Acetatifactor sp.]
DIHKAALKALALISVVCTVDETAGELIIKLVNITEEDIKVKLVSDIPMTDRVFMTTLTADSMQAGNSFDTPKAIIPITHDVKFAEGAINVSARSVNVIRATLRL